jgi:hypothetical protein
MSGLRGQRLLGLMLVAVAAVCGGGVAVGADGVPATAPAKPAATTQPSPELGHAKRLVAQLADNDYERRETARMALMGLHRSDLPALREAVRQSRPLVPSQRALLREIVTHVYLSGELYLADPDGGGFLGVRWPGFDPEQRGVLGIWRGIAILERSPGFVSYRLLQNGDVVLSVTARGEHVEINTIGELQRAITSAKAGELVKMQVLRQGRIIPVDNHLDPRPFNLSNVGFEELQIQRENQADAYWERDFAPLVNETIS